MSEEYGPQIFPSADDEDLTHLLLSLIAKGPSVPIPKPPLPVIERNWEASSSPSFGSGKIVGRHPELSSVSLRDIPEYALTRPSRGVSRGRQGFFHSRKCERTLHFRSNLEFDLMCKIEADPRATLFVEQPIRFKYVDTTGAIRQHTPDLYVQFLDRECFYEVKWEADAARGDNELRWGAIGPALAALGFSYSVVTERTLRREPAYTNLKTVFRARRAELPDQAVIEKVRHILKSGPTATSALLAMCVGISIRQVYRLVLQGLISIDMEKPLGPRSLLTNVEIPYEAIAL